MSLKVTRANPEDPDVAALIAAHVARSLKYYPADVCHSFDVAELTEKAVVLFVGRDGDAAVAIGGYVALEPEIAEMKSVFTAKAARGKGYGRAMVEHLMAEARHAGFRMMLLETGNDAPSAAARAVYEGLGFRYRGPFGDYERDPFAAYMEVAL